MHWQQGMAGFEALLQTQFDKARPMLGRRATQCQGRVRHSQPVEFEARGEFRGIALEGCAVEATFSAGGGVVRMVQVAGQSVDTDQALVPGGLFEDVAQFGRVFLIGCMAQRAMVHGAVGLFSVRGKQLKAGVVQAVAQMLEPACVTVLDEDVSVLIAEPGMAGRAPGL